ncbi:HpsJ family protein [Geminocystis sp. GBBB08]|uniref:HpsJ-like protein, cyanoexosortase A-associated n=1 Tax=Geminocystis sp. GBBB08 TaxID=2604140 RepID=UPI0027E2B18B|nr:HpsJ family protein [Geminocystis sp. GBBB08]MBL1208841.1 hypothetical protein [Geminocystis sp. GBBB08]
MIQSNQEDLNSNTETISNTETLDIQSKLNQKVDKIGVFSLNMLRSLGLWRLVGYAFLILFALDLAEIFIPPQFLNPNWEFEVFGALIEKVAIPLVALVLIFYGGNYLRKGWEFIVLTSLSWLCLFVGILFLLSVPLGIINTMRINSQISTKITEAANQRLEVLQKVETALKDVKNKQDMEILISQLNNSGNAPIIVIEQQLTQVKTNLTEFIKGSRNQISSQSVMAIKQQRKSLLKRSVKWNLGALISGVLFIMTWQMTKWARVRETINN